MYFLYDLVQIAFNVYSAAILIRIILSWLPVNPYNSLIRFICDITDPYLNIFRRILPPSPAIGLDFSPILAIIALQVIEYLLLRILFLLF